MADGILFQIVDNNRANASIFGNRDRACSIKSRVRRSKRLGLDYHLTRQDPKYSNRVYSYNVHT